jgi:hypothetical protein
MAENKKSFILYTDLLSVVKKLVEKDRINKTNYAGELFLTILLYVNDKDPIPIDFIVEMAFEPIRLSLKRDLTKYETYKDKQVANGKKGGRPKKTQITQPFILEPKKADSVNVSVSDNVSTIVDEETINKIFLEYREKYKVYANQLFKDTIFIESICKEFLNLDNQEVRSLTLKKYLGLFLNSLDQSKKIHNNKKDFQQHFPSWLRKQPAIVKVYPKQDEENPYKGQY